MFKEIIKTLGLAKDFENSKLCYGKRWFTSKTLWVNFIAVLAFWVNWKFKVVVIPPEMQEEIVTTAMAIINIALRFVTTQPVVAKEAEIICNEKVIKGEVVFKPVIKEPPESPGG
jgi:hypothetical protein